MIVAVALLVAIVAFAFWAPGLPVLQRRVVRVFAVYVAVADLMRGLALLAINPSPSLGSYALEPLLQPTYADGVAATFPVVALGLTAVVAGVYVLNALRLSKARRERQYTIASLGLVASAAYGLAYSMRVISSLVEAGAVANIAGRGNLIAPAVLGLVILTQHWRAAPSLRRLIALAALGEIIWALLAASKTPLFAFLLLLYLDPRRPRLRPQAVLAGATAVLLAFTVIQNLKPSSSQTAALRAEQSLGTQLVSTISNRFDGLRAATVAVRLGPGSYISPDDAALAAAQVFVPNSISAGRKESAGLRWGRLMYGSAERTFYAESAVAEGFAIAGLPGALVWCMSVGLLLGLVCRLILGAGLALRFVAAGLLGSSALFERGLLGITENISNAFQALIIASSVFLLLYRTDKTVTAVATT